MPEEEPIEALEGLLLAHMPLPASVSVTVLPTQTVEEPLMEEGRGFTVIIVVAIHPVGSV
jgi:hypothetical protein